MSPDDAEQMKKAKEYFDQNKDEIIEWDKYLKAKQFATLDDLAHFCKEWIIAATDKPNDLLLQHKVAILARKYFPQFVATYFMQSQALSVLLSGIVEATGGIEEVEEAQARSSVVPKAGSKLH